mgnify:CR=1 FL=1
MARKGANHREPGYESFAPSRSCHSLHFAPFVVQTFPAPFVVQTFPAPFVVQTFPASLVSLVPQRLDRVEPGRPARRVDPKEQPHGQREAHGDQRRA